MSEPMMKSTDPFLQVSVSKATGLQSLNIAKELVKFLNSTILCLVYLQVRNNQSILENAKN